MQLGPFDNKDTGLASEFAKLDTKSAKLGNTAIDIVVLSYRDRIASAFFGPYVILTI